MLQAQQAQRVKQAIRRHCKPTAKPSTEQLAQTTPATGAWVKAQRLACGLSQARLAVWMGWPYTQQTISGWERRPERIIPSEAWEPITVAFKRAALQGRDKRDGATLYERWNR